MSKKSDLKRAISNSEREIEALEKKRARSQSALMAAMLSNKPQNPMDAEYFRVFSALIDNERENLRKLIEELDSLEKKPEKEKKDKNTEKTDKDKKAKK